MRLAFKSEFKSIKHFAPIDLPNLTIISGLNGSGKTQLLKAIQGGHISADSFAAGDKSSEVRFFDWTTFVPNDVKEIDPRKLTDARNDLWRALEGPIDAQKGTIRGVLSKNSAYGPLGTEIQSIAQLSTDDIARIVGDEALAANLEKNFSAADQRISQSAVLALRNKKKPLLILRELQSLPRMRLVGLDYSDFFSKCNAALSQADFFQQAFGELFAGYHQSHLDNSFAKFLTTVRNEPTPYLSDEGFLAAYGEAPWDVVNRVLETAGLHYRIDRPSGHDGRLYQPRLSSKATQDLIKFADLSSGEKILMSLALCLYHAEDRRERCAFPKLLLFDEIDAPLHPAMTFSLINAVRKTLVDKLGVNVILTTHSPSTVALAPDDSIYLMTLDGTRLARTSKDRALAALTAGVPTLSIDYVNRRQVFVESGYDASNYDKIYQLLRPQLNPDISLNFIPSGGQSSGSCDQVKSLVNSLVEYGNRTVSGVIDWDLKNCGNERIRVLGNESRYSIENYVFDPLLLGALLHRNRKEFSRDDLQLKEEETHTDFVSFDSERLQNIATTVLERIKPHCEEATDAGTTDCEYCNGTTIKLPNWFLRFRGHDLEAAIKKAFPTLQTCRNTNELQSLILTTVADDMPRLLSRDFVLLFNKLQEFSSTGH